MMPGFGVPRASAAALAGAVCVIYQEVLIRFGISGARAALIQAAVEDSVGELSGELIEYSLALEDALSTVTSSYVRAMEQHGMLPYTIRAVERVARGDLDKAMSESAACHKATTVMRGAEDRP